MNTPPERTETHPLKSTFPPQSHRFLFWSGMFLFCIVIALGLCVRLWHLESMNSFATDEGNNGYMGIRILRHGDRPLRGVTAHFGALTHYLTAAMFGIAGTSVYTERLVPALASVAAIAVSFFLLWRLVNLRAAFLAGLLLVFSPWMIGTARVTWEMSMNILYVALALFFGTQHMQKPRWYLMLFVGFCIGASASGHLYIILLLLPFGIACLFTPGASLWQRLFHIVALGVGALCTLSPLLLASIQSHDGLLGNYAASGEDGAVVSVKTAILKTAGVIATLTGRSGHFIGGAILFSLLWAWWIAWQKKDRVALLFALLMTTTILFLPYVVGLELPGELDKGWCGAISRLLGAEHCQSTHQRYMDILYPLPLLLVSWCFTCLTRRRVLDIILYLAALFFFVIPLIQPAIKTITNVHEERFERLRPALAKIPPDACIISYTAIRDFVRLNVVAGERPVYLPDEYVHGAKNIYDPHAEKEAPPRCATTFLISAYQELHNPHLLPIEHVEVANIPLWYIYRLADPHVDDVLCPSTLMDTSLSGPTNVVGWKKVSDETEDALVCTSDICTGIWNIQPQPALRTLPLHLLARCNIVSDKAALFVSPNQGTTWQPVCNTGQASDPYVTWVDTGLIKHVTTSEPQHILFRAKQQKGENALSLKDLRLCPDGLPHMEQDIQQSPLKWF